MFFVKFLILFDYFLSFFNSYDECLMRLQTKRRQEIAKIAKTEKGLIARTWYFRFFFKPNYYLKDHLYDLPFF